MRKTLASVALATAFLGSSASAVNFGLFKISPEIGASVGYKKTDLSLNVNSIQELSGNDHLVYGAYGRLWLGVFGVMVAPQVKWEYLSTNYGSEVGKSKLSNLQYGGILGFEIPIIGLTPYIGGSYSTFYGQVNQQNLQNTWALNFGAKLDIPFTFLTIGVDGSWQKPKIGHSSSLDLLTVSATIGLSF